MSDKGDERKDGGNSSKRRHEADAEAGPSGIKNCRGFNTEFKRPWKTLPGRDDDDGDAAKRSERKTLGLRRSRPRRNNIINS